jgi:hypothetical protein
MIPIGLDCETALSRPALQAPPLACVAIGPSEWQTLLHHSDWKAQVTELLTNPDVLIVTHYGAYDFVVLCNEAPEIIPLVFDAYEQNRIACTLCRQKLIDIAEGVYRGFDDSDGETTKINYALEDLALRHLNRVLDKDTWRLRYGELIPLPLYLWPQGAKDYVCNDVGTTVDIYHAQTKWAHYLDDEFRQARASFWLKLMASWGIRTDAKGVKELAARTKRDCDKLASELMAAGLLWPDKHLQKKGGPKGKPGTRNTKAAHERVRRAYESQGKEVPLTDGGKSGNRQPCLDRVTCEESGDIVLIQYAQFSSLKTVLSKDIPMLEAGVYTPIHTTVEDILETGRTSTKKPNVQNPKRKGGIRECFAPACLCCGRVPENDDFALELCLSCGVPVTIMWSCDYGGLELCTLAQACVTVLGHSRLAEALNRNEDPHLMMAAQILRRPYDELKAIKKAGAKADCVAKFGKCTCAYCIVYDARQTGKVANFGFPGGLGAAALVFFALNNYGVRLTEDDARRLKRLWLELWPEMREYFAWISSISERPFPQICQLFVNRYRGGARYTELCNTIFQGLGGDISKAAGWSIYRAMYDATRRSVLYGSRGTNFVHDEFVGLSFITKAHECAYEVRRLMLDAAKPFLPDVTIDVEPALMYRYSKEAGPKFKGGRLIPWAA